MKVIFFLRKCRSFCMPRNNRKKGVNNKTQNSAFPFFYCTRNPYQNIVDKRMENSQRLPTKTEFFLIEKEKSREEKLLKQKRKIRSCIVNFKTSTAPPICNMGFLVSVKCRQTKLGGKKSRYFILNNKKERKHKNLQGN